MRFGGLVIDTLVCLTLAKWETVSGQFGGYLNFNRYVMSRYMQCFGEKSRNGGPGLGLVTIKRTTGYPTRTEVFLTEKGRAVAAQVFDNLRRLSRS